MVEAEWSPMWWNSGEATVVAFTEKSNSAQLKGDACWKLCILGDESSVQEGQQVGSRVPVGECCKDSVIVYERRCHLAGMVWTYPWLW